MTNFWCWFYKKYILVFCVLFIAITIGALLAPVFAYQGYRSAAHILYTFYRISCHQLAYRTWFLFGEQTFYPLRLAGIQDVISYEEISGNPAENAALAQSFIGSAAAGFKTALCQRDIVIPIGIVLAGIGFALSKRKWESIPILFWIVLGLLPMFLDGGVQWLRDVFPSFQIYHAWESTPLMRTGTGFLFGFTSGLILFPKLEQALWITKNNHNCRE